ncbi:MAG: hypothetical protein M3424_01635, partial [Actinomycetota bacterium]|nr:hypothetical protein [Actinomycetota bacterium]
MKLLASAAALVLVGLSSIWLWQDAVTQTPGTTPGVIITSQSPESSNADVDRAGGGGFHDPLVMPGLGIDLGGAADGPAGPVSTGPATADRADQPLMTQAWSRLGAAALAWEQAEA